jgi:hypothetical protein
MKNEVRYLYFYVLEDLKLLETYTNKEMSKRQFQK